METLTTIDQRAHEVRSRAARYEALQNRQAALRNSIRKLEGQSLSAALKTAESIRELAAQLPPDAVTRSDQIASYVIGVAAAQALDTMTGREDRRLDALKAAKKELAEVDADIRLMEKA